jgi:serine/threonine protein kinase
MKVELVKQDSLSNTYIVCGTKFEVEKRYELLDPMGQGAYGVVVAARDNEAEEDEEEENLVAIKKIERAFEHKVFMQRTLRELKI